MEDRGERVKHEEKSESYLKNKVQNYEFKKEA